MNKLSHMYVCECKDLLNIRKNSNLLVTVHTCRNLLHDRVHECCYSVYVFLSFLFDHLKTLKIEHAAIGDRQIFPR